MRRRPKVTHEGYGLEAMKRARLARLLRGLPPLPCSRCLGQGSVVLPGQALLTPCPECRDPLLLHFPVI